MPERVALERQGGHKKLKKMLFNVTLTPIIKAGWRAKVNLVEGVKSTYQWFLDNEESYRQ